MSRMYMQFRALFTCLLLGTIFCSSVGARDPATVWDLDELKKVPSAQWSPEIEREVKNDNGQPVSVTTRKVYYSNVPFQGKPTRVMAFFSKPKGDGPFPAMVLVHGGGGSAYSVWTELWAARGYVAIAMDLSGREVIGDSNTEGTKNATRRMPDGGPSQDEESKFSDFSVEKGEFRERWTYHSIAAIMRAHSLLLSLPCVDATRTGATGISWGGYLTCMVSGIDDRFKVIVPVYGCGRLEQFSFWTKRLSSMPRARAARWSDYFDPASYMARAKCKIFMLDGTDDLTYPLEIHRASWQLIPGADVRLQVRMAHSHTNGWLPKEVARYVNWVLNQGSPLPCLEPMQVKRSGGKTTVSARLKYGVKPAKARVHYTTDPGGFNESYSKWTSRNWSNIEATISSDGGEISGVLPSDLPPGEVRFFLEAIDSDGYSATTHYDSITVGQPRTDMKVFRAGSAKVDVSPKEYPVLVNGGFLPRFVSKTDDPLHARALVVDDGQERFAFLVIDNCEMSESVADEIKRLVRDAVGIPENRISVSATHCHSAPSLVSELACYPDEKYVKYLPPLAAKAVIDAFHRLQPARVGWTTVREPRYVFCRRFLMKEGTASSPPAPFTGSTRDLAQMNPGRGNPNIVARTGWPDQTLYLLAFETLEHKPLALLANYSTHYAGGAQNVSADYFGVFCSKVATLLGADENFTALMSNGTSGDTNCIDFLNPHQSSCDLHVVGTQLAEKAVSAWKSIRFADYVRVVAMEETITLEIRKPSADQVAQAKQWLAKLKSEKKQITSTADVYAFETVNIDALPKTRTLKLQAIRLGDFGICAIPCEVFSFTGHDLRAYTPLATNMVLGLTNGYNGYIPTTDQFALGGYTTWRARGCLLEEEAEPKIRAQLLHMLHAVAAEK